jgi:hypothetical protein
MTVLTDADLYLRVAATLLASWGEYVRGATGAAAQHSPGVPTAVFPNEPERVVGHTALGDEHDAMDVRERALALLVGIAGEAAGTVVAPNDAAAKCSAGASCPNGPAYPPAVAGECRRAVFRPTAGGGLRARPWREAPRPHAAASAEKVLQSAVMEVMSVP